MARLRGRLTTRLKTAQGLLLRRQPPWLTLVDTLAQQISEAVALPTLLQTTASQVRQQLGCDHVVIYQGQADGTGQWVAAVESQGARPHQCQETLDLELCATEALPPEGISVIADLATAALPQGYRDWLARHQIRARVMVPIQDPTRSWGLLVGYHRSIGPWDDTDLRGLQRVAGLLGVAFRQADWMAQLQQSQAELAAQAACHAQQLDQIEQRLLSTLSTYDDIQSTLLYQHQFLRQVLDSLYTFVAVLTPDGVLIEVNQAPLVAAGLQREQVIGQPFATSYWWAYAPSAQAKIQQAIHQASQGTAVRFEIPVQGQAGDRRMIDFSIVPLRDEQGHIVYLIPSGNDVTDRKQAETALRQSQSQRLALAAIVEFSQDAIISKTLEGTITSWNAAAEQLFGYSAAEAIGQPVTLLIPADRHAEAASIFQRLRQGEAIKTYDTQRRHKDGTLLDVALTISPLFDEMGQVVGASKIVRDISERKAHEQQLAASEARFQKLADTLPGILYTAIQPQGGWFQLTYVNAQASTLLGLSVEALLQDPSQLYEMIHPADRAGYEAATQASLATLTTLRHEWRMITPSGEIKWIQVTARPEGLPNQDVRWFGVAIDITPRKQAELALSQAKEQLELVLQASSEGFSDWDVVTGEIYFSPRWKAILGYAEHELENSLALWNALVFPADREAAEQLLEDYSSGKIDQFSMVQRHHHKRGFTVHLLTRIIHLKDAQGQVVRRVGSHLDVTAMVEMQKALQTSEMQLSSVLHSSLDGIMAFRSIRDRQGTILDFEYLLSNPTACQLVGRTADQLIGKRLLEEMPGHRESGLFDDYVRVVETGEPYQREFHYCHDGLESWFENIAVKLADGFAVTFREVTKLKQSEQALQQANQLLKDRVADLDQRHAEMLLLSEMSDFLQACLTVEEACKALGSLVEPLFPGCSGGLFLTSTARNQVSQVSQWGPTATSGADFHPHDCWALRRGRLHRWSLDHRGLRCQHVPAEVALATTLCIPLLAQGETLGLFYLSADQPPALAASKQQLARTVAEQVALAIANLELRETLHHQSIRDPLTGLFNRRYLEEALAQEIIRAHRHHHPIGVIMIDVDHFKRFNDTYGHEAGDHVLQVIGTFLKDSVRGSDIVCRYGGEEMTLVLPGLSLAQAQIKAESIRQIIADQVLTYNNQPLGCITVSLGVASYPNHGSTGATLIQTADVALYRAKTTGRNQVIAAP